tara:strand:+ start:41 stop:298 length:258 start_codon:yes stop_codon:yes gene_type:complete
MSKKKSYMDNKNLLSENFFKKLKHKIANKIAIRNIKKDKQVKKDMVNLNKDIQAIWDDINELEKLFNPKAKPFKPKKITVDDLIG